MKTIGFKIKKNNIPTPPVPCMNWCSLVCNKRP